MMYRMLSVLVVVALCPWVDSAADIARDDLDQLLDSTVHGWRFKLGDVAGAEAPDFDDSDWEMVDVGHQWWPHDSVCWFRKRITIPETVNGIPVAGSTLRLRGGMDNEARAYVNGELKQEFSWSDGDFVVAENAQPGDTVCVALRGVNRPGYGSLYEARLLSSAGQAMVDALGDLLAEYDRVESYVRYGPSDAKVNWISLVYSSMQRIELDAFRADDEAAFLESVDAARRVLLSDRQVFEGKLKKVAQRLAELKPLLAQGAESGQPMAYQRVDARVAESFLQYAREDMAEEHAGHTLRALWAAECLYRTSHGALREAHAILQKQTPDLPSPRYETGPLSIQEGNFYQNGRPIFFTGVGHFSQVRQDVPILTDYGLNIIQIEMGPRSVVLGPEEIDDRPIREDLLAVLENAAKHNLAVNLLISPHYFPDWALERHPELAACGHGFMRYCIDAPESREIHEKYLRALMPVIADHPALHSICLSNEPQYDGRCAHSTAQFRQWLEARHGAVDALNAICGTGFASFDDVPIPQDASNYALFYDYCRFNQDRFLGFHQFLRDLIHEFDPDLPVHAKVMSHAFGDPGKFEVGVDYEDFTRLGTIAGNDCIQIFNGGEPTEYLQRWQDMALNYTFQRSVAPNQPVFNSEDHIISDGDTRYIPDAHIRTAYWTQALHGQGAATTWVWERGQSGDLEENILTRANCVRALGRVALDLNRAALEMYTLQRAPSDMAILYSASSMLPSPDFTAEASAAFEGAYFADTVPAFVTEDQVLAGSHNPYRLIVAPRAAHVPDAVVAGLQAYLAGGGTVMTVGACFTHDEYGRPREKGLEAAGEGRLVAYPDPLTPRAYREILDRLLDQAGCERPVRLRGEYGEPVWGVNLRSAIRGDQRLVSLVNYGRMTQQVVLDAAEPPVGAVDVLTQKDVSFPLALPPLEPVLLALRRKAG